MVFALFFYCVTVKTIYRQIKSLGDGNEDSDPAVNVKQLNEMETKLINFVLNEIRKNNTYMRFLYGYTYNIKNICIAL